MAGTVSYSQVAEDLIAAYLLGNPRDITYVDIGCLWPVKLSNTYFFYERGGKGLCIDPNPTVADEYRKARPRDIFANCGVGISGSLDYYMFANPALNTFSKTRADRVATNPARPLQEVRSIPVKPLAQIFAENGFAGIAIDFMSIDIEGYEMEVLPSVDWQAIAPRVIVCEVFQAGKSISDNQIIKYLESQNYTLAAFTEHDAFFRRVP